MSDSPFLSHFSPQWTRPEALEQILVQRESLLADSVAKIRESILTGNKHHLLFIGSRGAGKTHLITLIHHRLQQADLVDRARFAWLNEDEIATSFLKLLVLIHRSLSERYPDEFRASTIRELAGLDPLVAEDKLGQSLLRGLGHRTLVVLMENLDSLFRTLPDVELLRWRAFVQNHPVFATIGTAQALFSGVSERTEPFFGFFDTRHLEPLSVEDARLLLKNIARIQGKTDLLEFLETPTGKARVAAIHDLAGGNPRLYLIFSEFLTRTALNELVRPFEEMVDRQLTSYYQERLRWLTPLQREIVQLLCHHGRPIPVKQIAEGLFTTQGTISGQLRQLRDMRYLRFQSLGREVFYELAEPLMRLALQVKETHNRKPLALIVDFLRVWHDRPEIEQRLTQLTPASPDRRYYAEALALHDSGAPNLRHEILREGLENLPPDQCDDETLIRARCLAEESDLPADWTKLGGILRTRKECKEAIHAFSKVVESKVASVAMIAKALLQRGDINWEIGRYNEAMADLNRVVELPSAPEKLVSNTLILRGARHEQAGQRAKAIADYTRALEIPSTRADIQAIALLKRGVLHSEAGRRDEAVTDYTSIINLPKAPALVVGSALFNRAGQHKQSGRMDESLADYTRVIDLMTAPTDVIAEALLSRGLLHTGANRSEEAIADYTRAIDLPGTSSETVFEALYNRGTQLKKDGRKEEAIADYTRAINLHGSSIERMVNALINRAALHADAGRQEEAINDYTRIIELPGSPPSHFAIALNYRGFAYVNSGQFEPALRDLAHLLATPHAVDVSELIARCLHHYASLVVLLIGAHSTDPQRWTTRLREFLPLFARHGGLAQLGDALVQHLPKLAASPLNHAAYDAWATAWSDALGILSTEDQDRLEIPLRLLRAGIDYLKTQQPASLLVLPAEERRVLRQTLGLPAETHA